MSPQFVVDRAGMAYLTDSPTGPVGRDFRRRVRTLTYRAKVSAPIAKPDPRDPFPRRTPPGALKASIKSLYLPVNRDGQSALVGANPVKGGRAVGYALYMHEGTSPHVIRPRRAPALRFFWKRIGDVMVTTRVMHPGTRPVRYLTRWLREFVR